MKRTPLDSITKISQVNLDRIARLKISGFEPNDYIINQALDLLEKKESGEGHQEKLETTTKISSKTLNRIAKLKPSGYETNDYVIAQALSLLEKERGIRK